LNWYSAAGGVPRLEDEAGADQLVERGARLGFAAGRRCRHQLVGEVAANRRPALGDLARRRTEPVEPRQQRSLQRRRHRCPRAGDRSYRPTRRGARRRLRGFEDRLRHLLEKQRHAVSALDDLVDNVVGEPREISGEALHKRRAVASSEPGQRQYRHMRLANPARVEFGPISGK
jgi:hypothetical protein